MRKDKILSKPIRTKLELCKLIGISRNTLDRYLCMKGAPSRTPDGWSLEAVNRHIASHAERETTLSKTSTAIGALKARELTLRCDRLAFHLQRERGEYILRVEIAQKLRVVLGRMVQVLEQKLVNELPVMISGLDVVQCRIKSRDLFDSTIAEIRGLDYLLE